MKTVVKLLPHLLFADDPGASLHDVLVVAGQALGEPGVAPAAIGDQQVGELMIAGPGLAQLLRRGAGGGKKFDPGGLLAKYLGPGDGVAATGGSCRRHHYLPLPQRPVPVNLLQCRGDKFDPHQQVGLHLRLEFSAYEHLQPAPLAVKQGGFDTVSGAGGKGLQQAQGQQQDAAAANPAHRVQRSCGCCRAPP